MHVSLLKVSHSSSSRIHHSASPPLPRGSRPQHAALDAHPTEPPPPPPSRSVPPHAWKDKSKVKTSESVTVVIVSCFSVLLHNRVSDCGVSTSGMHGNYTQHFETLMVDKNITLEGRHDQFNTKEERYFMHTNYETAEILGPR